tara:strand:- start:118 stop:531 length:414 start_codon:yes stop_codon:yes gene_type:complete
MEGGDDVSAEVNMESDPVMSRLCLGYCVGVALFCLCMLFFSGTLHLCNDAQQQRETKMSLQKIKQSIHANAQEYLISDIGEDSEVFEVQLKHPYVNYDDESTIWVYAKENLTLDGGSIDNMLEDLQCWLSCIEDEVA